MRKVLILATLFLFLIIALSAQSTSAQSSTPTPTPSPLTDGTYSIENGTAEIDGKTYEFSIKYGQVNVSNTGTEVWNLPPGEYSLSGGTADINKTEFDFSLETSISSGKVYVSNTGDVVLASGSGTSIPLPATIPPIEKDFSGGTFTLDTGRSSPSTFAAPGWDKATIKANSNAFRFDIIPPNSPIDFSVEYNASTGGNYSFYASEGYGPDDGAECVWDCVDSSRIDGTMWEWFNGKGINNKNWIKNPADIFSGDEDIYSDESEWGNENFGADDASSPSSYLGGSFAGEGGIHNETPDGPQYGKVDDDITKDPNLQRPKFFSYLANDENWEVPRSIKPWNLNASRQNITDRTKSVYPYEGLNSGDFDETGDVILTETDAESADMDRPSDSKPGIKGSYSDLFSISPMTRVILNKESLACSASGGGGWVGSLPSWLGGSSGGGNERSSGCSSDLDLTEPRIKETGNDIIVRHDVAVKLPKEKEDTRDFASCVCSNAPPSSNCDDFEYLYQTDGTYYNHKKTNVSWISVSAKTTSWDPVYEEEDNWGNKTNPDAPGVGSYYELRNVTNPTTTNQYVFEDVSFSKIGGVMNESESIQNIGHRIAGPKPKMKGAININITVHYNISMSYEHIEWTYKCDDDSVEDKDRTVEEEGVSYFEYNVSDNETYVLEEHPMVDYIDRIHIRGEPTVLNHVELSPTDYANARKPWQSIKRKNVKEDSDYYGLKDNYIITGYYQFFASRDKRWDVLQNLNVNPTEYSNTPGGDARLPSCEGTDVRTCSSKKIIFYDLLETDETDSIGDGGTDHALMPVYQFAFPGANMTHPGEYKGQDGKPKNKVGYRWVDESATLSYSVIPPKLSHHEVCDRTGDATDSDGACYWSHLNDSRTNRTTKQQNFDTPTEFVFESRHQYPTDWEDDSGRIIWWRAPLRGPDRPLEMERLVKGSNISFHEFGFINEGYSEATAAEPSLLSNVTQVGNVTTGKNTKVRVNAVPPKCNTKPYTLYCTEQDNFGIDKGFPAQIMLNKSAHGEMYLQEVAPRDVRNTSSSNINDDLNDYSSAFRKEIEPERKDTSTQKFEVPANVQRLRVVYESDNHNLWEGARDSSYLFPTLTYAFLGSGNYEWPQYSVLDRLATCANGAPCPDLGQRVLYQDDDGYPWLSTEKTFNIKDSNFSTMDKLFRFLSFWTFLLIIAILVFGYVYTEILYGRRKNN